MTVATVVADSACREARAVSNYRAGEARRAAVSRGQITRRQAGAGAESPRAAEGSAGVSGRRRPSKYRWSHAESRMGSIQHAVGTRGPGRCRRHGPSFSCLGQNDLPFWTGGRNALGKTEVRFSEKTKSVSAKKERY